MKVTTKKWRTMLLNTKSANALAINGVHDKEDTFRVKFQEIQIGLLYQLDFLSSLQLATKVE
jgi:hypothetical protein